MSACFCLLTDVSGGRNSEKLTEEVAWFASSRSLVLIPNHLKRYIEQELFICTSRIYFLELKIKFKFSEIITI